MDDTAAVSDLDHAVGPSDPAATAAKLAGDPFAGEGDSDLEEALARPFDRFTAGDPFAGDDGSDFGADDAADSVASLDEYAVASPRQSKSAGWQ